jgi:hypothetical protein
MTAATALKTAADASPELAVAAVEAALERLGLSHAGSVLLFLSPEFSRIAVPTLRAVGRAAQCIQVAGGIAAGVVTETEWSFDGPAAAAMVLAGGAGIDGSTNGAETFLSLCAEPGLPTDWRSGTPRFGALFDDSINPDGAQVFAQGRLCQPRQASLAFTNTRVHVGVAPGQQQVSPWLFVGEAKGFDLLRIGNKPAAEALQRYLPAEWRTRADLSAGVSLRLATEASGGTETSRDNPVDDRALPIIDFNPDGSVTLCEAIPAGARIALAVRQPIGAEQEMNALVDQLIDQCPQPAFGLFFSCIGRGPYFYEGQDRDWQTVRNRFPGLPFVGAYGNAQLAPGETGNRTLRNAVILGLCETRLGD